MIYIPEAQKIRQKQKKLCPKGDDRIGHKVFARGKISLMTAISIVYLVADKSKLNAWAAIYFLIERIVCESRIIRSSCTKAKVL